MNNKIKLNKTIFLGFSLIAFIALISFFYIWYTHRVNIEWVEITNKSSNSFTVVWKTDKAVNTKLWYSENPEMSFAERFVGKTAIDDRDIEINPAGEYVVKEEGQKKRILHHATIRNLDPEKEYYFWLGSSFFPNKPSSITGTNSEKTYPLKDDLYIPNPGYGRMLDSNNNPIEDMLIITELLDIDQSISEENETQEEINDPSSLSSSKISTFTNEQGGWSIDLNSFSYSDGTIFEIQPNTQISFTIKNQNDQTYQETIYPDKTKPFDTFIFDEDAFSQLHSIEQTNFEKETVSLLDTSLSYNTLAFGSFFQNVTDAVNKVTEAVQEASAFCETSCKDPGATTYNFGPRGTSTWCQCCAANCGGNQPACREQGYGSQYCSSTSRRIIPTPIITNAPTPTPNYCYTGVFRDQGRCLSASSYGIEQCNGTRIKDKSCTNSHYRCCTLRQFFQNVPPTVPPTSTPRPPAFITNTPRPTVIPTNTPRPVVFASNTPTPTVVPTIESPTPLPRSTVYSPGQTYPYGNRTAMCCHNSEVCPSGCDTHSNTIYSTSCTGGYACLLPNETTDVIEPEVDNFRNMESSCDVQEYDNLSEGIVPPVNGGDTTRGLITSGVLDDQHPGIDYINGDGIVRATANGRVSFARTGNFSYLDQTWTEGLGAMIIIDHGAYDVDPIDTREGYKSVYGHMQRNLLVSKGDWVCRGQAIGYIGNTGTNSTGQHLHFEIRRDFHFNSSTGFNGGLWYKNMRWVLNPYDYYINNPVYIPVQPAESFGKLDNKVTTISNAQSRTVNQNGLYEVSLNSSDYQLVTNRVLIPSDQGYEIIPFIDENGDRIRQDNEELLASEIVLDVNKVSEVFSYNIQTGWNLISFPFINEEIPYASDLTDLFIEEGVVITSVAEYTSEGFNEFVSREFGSLYSTDFPIIPGKSYFIKSISQNSTINITGNPIESEIPINLINGWNLISIFNPDRDYTAEAFLDHCINNGFECDTLASYLDGRYSDIVVKEDAILFGNDYNIIDQRGYFLRVSSGGGNNLIP